MQRRGGCCWPEVYGVLVLGQHQVSVVSGLLAGLVAAMGWLVWGLLRSG